MTIAAGFRFSDGILLCADTQHTYPGAMKLHASKIVRASFAAQGGTLMAAAISGNVPYAHMAVSHCERAILKKAPVQMNSVELVLAVEDALEDFHQRHVYGHPGFQRAGGPDFQLLVALWPHADKNLTLLVSNDSAVTQVIDYECVGSGSFLAHYLIPTIFRHSKMGLKDTVNIAVHVLRETKDYVDTCGGGSEFIVITKDGKFSPPGYMQISSGESLSRVYREAMRRLYVYAADLDRDKGELRKEFDDAYDFIESYRKRAINSRASADLIETLQRVKSMQMDRTTRKPKP